MSDAQAIQVKAPGGVREVWEGLRAPDWFEDAACRHLEPTEADEAFFGTSLPDWAAELCAGCPVRRECYDRAVELDAEGFWGGVSAEERRAEHGRSAKRQGCGSAAGAQAHRKRGEPVCEACKRAWRERQREYRRRRAA